MSKLHYLYRQDYGNTTVIYCACCTAGEVITDGVTTSKHDFDGDCPQIWLPHKFAATQRYHNDMRMRFTIDQRQEEIV